ncbi:MAG: hypothetical protein DBX55_06945 [Verrucomicrobia bacterium]|nr:MAG: hypothetical protein DBX55_06945 [Verrucomicrobiota bacterium]
MEKGNTGSIAVVKTVLAFIALAASGALCAARGQESAVAATAAIRAETSESGAESASEPWTERESLVLQSAAEKYLPWKGFTPLMTWTGELWGNASGGTKTGVELDSLITFGFEQDISEALSSKGLGKLGLTAFYYVSSGDFTSRVGSQSDPSNIFASDMVRIFEIYYQNEFETEWGAFGFRIGQLAADEDFMGMDYADIFLNSSFGAIPTNAGIDLYNGNGAFSQYALATLGATVYYNNGDFDAIVGIYNGNCGMDVSGNHGFDYDLQGVALWYQLGYNYTLCGLSGRAMFGGNYNSGTFTNFYTQEGTRNFYSFYWGLQQDLLTDSEGNAILGGFVRMAWAPDEDTACYTKYLDVGILWFGPIPDRADDVLALGFSGMELGSGFRRSEDINRYDTMLELTYRMQMTQAIMLQPTFQTYFNATNERGETKVAYVLGARLEINF